MENDEERSLQRASVSPMRTPPTGDTDRFMRISYLLVDIGARVLRQLLRHHTVTSTCTLDQYLAKMKNTFNKHNRVFKKSFMEIMFPPNGNDTNLDDYDTTLLCAIFNNVVPSLSQQEKDMIQNLRENRNKLFACATSCQINASDFEIHWNDISSTLITLSQQCGDAAFVAKMSQEIHLAKISATQAGSYLEQPKAWFDMIDIGDALLNVRSRLQALESKENPSADMLDSTRKRRPETDGLRQLKYQTEDQLDTLRRLKCIPTNQAKEAKELFEGKRFILIRGNPGEGKTTLALYLIDNEMYRGRRVVLHSPRDWKTVETDWVDIVVIEDVFGKFDLNPGHLQEWMVYLPTIQEYVDAGKLHVIITTRTDILSMAYSRLGSLKLFSDDLTLTLSSKQLTHSEKISILNRELQRHSKNMKEDEKEKCIANFGGLIGFPQYCSLFARDSKLFSSGPDFFKSPEKFFVQNITYLDSTRFLCLAFLFCNGKIWAEHLSPETMPETSKDLLVELASSLHISGKNAAITLLTDAYDSFLELYVVKSMSDGKLFIQFTNDTVYEVVGQVLGDRCLEMVLKYGASGYLYQRTYTAKVKDSTSQSVFIPMSFYGLLAKRMVHDLVNRSLVQSIVKHSAFRQHDYLMKLKLELQKGNTIKDFFTAGHDSSMKGIKEGHFTCSSISGEDLLEGVCITFMEYILQCDEDVVTLVFNEFLEFLECAHINHSSNCWQCEQKQQLLELALYYHHFQIADILIAMNACYTSVSLCNAAMHGDLGRVQTVLETLKRSQIFSPSCKEAKYALYRAQISGNQSLSLLFLKEGITLDNWNIEDQQSRLHKEDDLVEGDAMSQAGLPPEILRMDEQSQQLYREALEAGKVKVYNIRLMIVGHLGVGKTTLVKRILGEKVEKAPHIATEGIEVHPRCCKIDQDDDMKKWIVEQNEHCSPNQQILVNMVYKCVANKSNDDIDQEEKSSMQHLTEVSGAVEESFEPDKEMSKSAVMQPDTNLTSDKNTLYEKEKVHENQTSLDLDKSHSVETDSNKAISIKGRSDTNIHSDLHEFVTKCGTMTPSEKTFCYVTMLDFAGEFVYYTTHQAFMSWRTLYLLVTDISKSLDESVKGDECSMKRSIQDYVIYWFNSIYSHGKPSKASRQCEGRTQEETENDEKNLDGAAECPPVILVATHSDKLPEGENNKIKKYFESVERMMMHRPQRFLLKETFAINNFGPADDIDALKQKIFELAKEQDYWGEEIPGTWLVLEQKLMELKRKEKIIEYSRVDKINNSSDVKIKKPEELEVFLRFEHDLGNILFFNTEKLRGKIVLDPVWVIDGVKNLTLAEGCMIKKHPQQLKPQWYKFKDTGQLTESLIGHIWSGDGCEDFAKNREHLLDLMEELSIIAKPVKKDDNVQDQNLCYWVPCVIDKTAPDHVKNRGLCEGITRTSTLGFVSKTEFIPVGVFHRLLASFLSIWQPVKENDNEYRLYSDCCEFELEDCHSLLLIMNDYAILATILRCEEEDPDNELCCSIKRCISSTLIDITSCISPNVKFDMHVKCDKSSIYTLDGLHPYSEKRKKRCQCSKPDHPVKVENLMKFWERKDSYQQQQEAEKSDFLNAAKQRDHTTQHDSPGPIGMDKNLGLQDKTRLSFKYQAGNMKAEIDQTEAVFVHDLLAQRAKSVGMIRSPGTCGTGFRVGPHYIMTAKHVVDQIMNGTPVPLQPLMHVHPYHPLSNDAVFIDFSYERDGIPSGENLRFYFKPEIVYSNEDLDTVVLKLKPDSREYPPPLTNFHDVAHSPQDRSHGYFIGHSRASIKKTDRYNFVMPTPDTITAAKKWSMDQVNVDGYVGIDDPNRVLFNCTFERGASGAPGLWICPRDGNAYVELMLLRGYPSWYYDDKHKDKAVGIGSKFLVEQGVTMKSIYDDMHIRNEPLWKEIFVMRL